MAKTKLQKDVEILKRHLIEKVPPHFGARHIFTAFFGAILVGLTFTLKGLLFNVSNALTIKELSLIIFATVVVLTAEITFIGYNRVKKKEERKFFQFWIKRLLTYYGIALIVSVGLVYIYGLYNLALGPHHVLKIVIAVSMPCAIGAAAADLLNRY
jgi:uncharacterized membrane protein